jgi:hypothetical protein
MMPNTLIGYLAVYFQSDDFPVLFAVQIMTNL